MRRRLPIILILLLASFGLLNAQSQYRSPGTGVTVDLSSANNWQVYSGGTWITATTAPTGLASGSTILIQATDIWANGATASTVPTGVVLTNNSSAATGAFTTGKITMSGTMVYSGSAAQVLPPSNAFVGSKFTNLTVNNAAGVTSGTGSFNIAGVLYVQSGVFNTNNGGNTFTLSGSIQSGGGTINSGSFLVLSGITQTIVNTDFLNSSVVGQLYRLNVNNSTITTNGVFTIANNFNLTSGTLTLGGTLSIKATGTSFTTATNTGSIVAGSNTVSFDGSAQQAVLAAGFFASNSINNLAITNTTAGTAVTYPVSLTIGNSLAVKLATGVTPLAVTGTATIGGALTVSSFSTTPTNGQVYTILTGSTAVNGTFSSLILPGGYTGSLAYSGTDVKLTVTPSAINNANLSSLALSAGTLSPIFASGTTSYTAAVPNANSSITLTPTLSDAFATVTVNGTTVNNGSASGAIGLNVGSNTITTVVTAKDGTTTQTYTVTVTRSAPLSDATLSGLAISAGALSPAFVSGTASYTASVSSGTSSITVTPTTNDPSATVTVNGTAVNSGTASGAISLNVGFNTITTVVTSHDGTTMQTYTIMVTRATPSSDATLSALTLSAGSLSPAFASSTTSYTVTEPNGTSSITITPTSNDPSATITVNGTTVASGSASGSIGLDLGNNTITTVVTSPDGTTNKTYTTTVTSQTPLYRFDLGVPANFTVTGSTLVSSTAHTKSGSALAWNVSNGAVLSASSLGITSSQTGNFSASAAQFYIYNAVASNDTLVFSFYTNGNNTPQRVGHMLLNFTGWRDYHRSYRYDYNNGTDIGSGFALDKMTISYSSVNSSSTPTIYLDEFTMVGDVNNRLPGPYMKIDLAQFTPGYSFLEPLQYFLNTPPNTAAPASSPQEQTDAMTVKSKYPRSIPAVTPANVSVAKNYVSSCGIYRNGDGSINGTRGLINLNNLDTLVQIGNYIGYLTEAAVNNSDATAASQLLLFSEFILDQGLAEGGRNNVQTNDYSHCQNLPVGFLIAVKSGLLTDSINKGIIKMLKWSNGYNIIYNTKGNLEVETDYIYLKATFLLELAGDTSVDYQVRDYYNCSNFLSLFANIKQGSEDGIKPDGLGYHHNFNNVPYFYAWGTYADRANSLSGTVFKITPQAFNNMAFAYKSLFLPTAPNASLVLNSSSGRHPYNAFTEVSQASFQEMVNIGGDISGKTIDTAMAQLYNYTYQTNFYNVPARNYDSVYHFNYAQLGVKRRGNWIVGMKGFTNTILGTEIYAVQNRYGRYQSYGALEVLYAGGMPANGWINNGAGWDWNVEPGTTNVQVPFTSLQPTVSGTVFDFQRNSFAGALSLGDKHGIFAMDFLEQNTSGFTNNGLSFKKSVFVFDTLMVCLGSSITSTNSSNITSSNLFQAIDASANFAPIYVNSTSPTPDATYNNTLSTASSSAWMVTGQTTGFYIPQNGGNVTVLRGSQTTPDQSDLNQTKLNTANYSKAYINHGNAPTNANYQYVVVPGTTPATMQTLAATLDGGNIYTVLKQTDSLHAVFYKPDSVTSYAFFKPNNNVNIGYVNSISNKGLLGIKKKGDTLFLTINNPDLNVVIDATDSVDGWHSTPQNINLVLNGNWTVLANNSNASISSGNSALTAGFTLKDGFSGSLTLLASQQPIVSITAPANNSIVLTGSNVIISATASSPKAGGSITQVDFYSGSTLLGSSTTAPYSFTWNNIPAGKDTLTAVATDNFGSTTTSAKVIITASATTFTPGVLAVLRLGGVNGTNGASGSSTPGTSGTPIHIDKYAVTAPGTFTYQSSIDLPVNSTNNIFASSSTNEGYISQSGNKQWTSIMGYVAPSASGNIYNTTTGNNPNLARTLGLIKYDGTTDLSTALSNFPASGTAATAQGSITNDGTNLWCVTNQGVSPMGVLYTTPGSTNATSGNSVITTSSTGVVTSAKNLSIYGGDLYYTANSGNRIGTVSATGGLPITLGGSVMTALPVASGSTAFSAFAPSQMVMFDLSPDILGYDVMYVTSTGTGTAGIYKYCKNSVGQWVSYGTFGSIATDGSYFGITGEVINGLPVLYATTGVSATQNLATNQLLQLTETAGYNASMGATITASTNATVSGLSGTIRGVAFFPTASYYYNGTGNLNDVTSWGTNMDGSGTAPTNFTTDEQTFFIINGTNATMSANLTVSGVNSKIIVGDGTNATSLTIPATFSITSQMDVYNNATLNIQNTQSPNLHFVAQNSTINFAASSSQTITPMAFGNFANSNNSSATINGTITVKGNINQSGLLKGNGTLIVPNGLINKGTIAPGNSPGLINVTGNFTNDATTGVLNMELGGNTTPGTDYDQVAVSGSLTVAGTLNVLLVNGWVPKVGDTYTLLTGSSINGTFTTVNLPAGVTGTVTYNQPNVVLNIVSVLPLKLLSFSGAVLPTCKNKLQWKTADEDNVEYFGIERSVNGNNFTLLQKLTAVGKGDNNYQVVDSVPLLGSNYYRLKMVDRDGTYVNSNIVLIQNNCGSVTSWDLYPNPVNKGTEITIGFSNGSATLNEVLLTVTNVLGQRILVDKFSAGKGENVYKLTTANWAKGMYFISLYDAANGTLIGQAQKVYAR